MVSLYFIHNAFIRFIENGRVVSDNIGIIGLTILDSTISEKKYMYTTRGI